MRALIETIACVALLFCMSCNSNSPMSRDSAVPDVELAKIQKEFESSPWGFSQIKENVKRDLTVVQSSTLDASDLPGPVHLVRIMARASSPGATGTAFRILAIYRNKVFFDSLFFDRECGVPGLTAEFGEIFQLENKTLLPLKVQTETPGCINAGYEWHETLLLFDPSREFARAGEIELLRRVENSEHPEKSVLEIASLQAGGSADNESVRKESWLSIFFGRQVFGGNPLVLRESREGQYGWSADQTAIVLKAVR